MTTTVHLAVSGIPAPQGSMRAFVRGGRAVVTHSKRASLDAWRIAVAQEAREAMAGADLLAGPLYVRITFRMPRPAGHVGKRGLLPSAPAYPSTAPDVDKLARACLDALTGVVWGDDSQVGDLWARKLYADVGAQPGAVIVVSERPAP